MTRIITIAGSLAQKPGHGGHTWVFLQYILGFKRLGWDVLFLDSLEPEMCVDVRGMPCSLDASTNLRYLLDVMQGFGLEGSFSLIYNGGERFIGVNRAEALERVGGSAFLLNITMGSRFDPEILASAPRRVFLDLDPGFGQMWRELKLHDLFRGHDALLTIGENIGRQGCTVPTCGLQWITTRQPVVLERWPGAEGRASAGESAELGERTGTGEGRYTTIASWRGPYASVEYGGRTYGLRCHEFRKFAGLPGLCPGSRFEIALDIHPSETRDQELLRAKGWSLADPRDSAADPSAYQDYVRRSRAEFMVAKNMYVQTGSGWFSDRSICYLASGKPVLAQDTGIKHLYPTGAGLLTFTTLEEAAAGVEAIKANYERHCQAAREIAEEFFDSDKVLTRLLGKLGVASG